MSDQFTLLHSCGTQGALPGELWGVHEITWDQLGILCAAEVFEGRPQKFKLKKGT
jgi:hypothetical protein